MPAYENIVVLTRRTALQELSDRFGTRSQARFYIEQEAKRQRLAHAEVAPSFAVYEGAEQTYQGALEQVREALPRGVRTQFIDSAFLPQFTFGEGDLVLILGPDGLVVNAAKYLDGQPILAVNPDPATIEGVLL